MMIAALVPLALFFVFSFSLISKAITDNAMVLAETLRDARSERITTSVRNAFDNSVSSAEYAFETGTLNRYNSPDTLKPLRELIDRSSAVERIVLYDRFFEPVAAVGRNGDLSESQLHERVRIELPEIQFDTNQIISELDLGDATSRLLLFAEVITGTRAQGYVTAMYDYGEIARLIAAPARAGIAVYNGRYQRIADSFGLTDWTLVIDSLTERMLDGFTETVRLDGTVHSYGYVDFGTAELFIDVAVPLEIGARRVNSLIITFVFFFLVTAFFSVIVAWTQVRSVVQYGEAVLVRSRFSDEMPLFNRFSTNLAALQRMLDSAEEMQQRMKALADDASSIVEAMPNPENEDGP